VESERNELLDSLQRAFPQRAVVGPIAPHDCDECAGIRAELTGKPWGEVESGFVDQSADILPLLCPEAYAAYLPAWLRRAVVDPDGDVAFMLLVNLAGADASLFTAEQRRCVVSTARFLATHTAFGPDEISLESFQKIERNWSGVAA
jgi:hypothetical protein